MKNKKEVFKDIPGYEGYYQASNLGTIRSIERTVKYSNDSFHSYPETILKQRLNHNGYFVVMFSKQNKIKLFCVHQLVAMAFLGHKPNGFTVEVDHINNNKTDNRLENLQLISHRENSSKDKWRYDKTSRHTGVNWSKSSKKWKVGIRINNVKKHLGYFDDEDKAFSVYQEALKLHEQGKSIQPIIDKYVAIPSSKYNGVSRHKKTELWQARININKKPKYIGIFKTELEAFIAIQNYKKQCLK